MFVDSRRRIARVMPSRSHSFSTRISSERDAGEVDLRETVRVRANPPINLPDATSNPSIHAATRKGREVSTQFDTTPPLTLNDSTSPTPISDDAPSPRGVASAAECAGADASGFVDVSDV